MEGGRMVRAWVTWMGCLVAPGRGRAVAEGPLPPVTHGPEEACVSVGSPGKMWPVRAGGVVDGRGLGLALSGDGEGIGGAAAGEGGHGLRNLRERALSIGVHPWVDSRLGEGTSLFILWPWKAMV